MTTVTKMANPRSPIPLTVALLGAFAACRGGGVEGGRALWWGWGLGLGTHSAGAHI